MYLHIVDTIGDNGEMTIMADEIQDRLPEWYPDAPAEVTKAIEDLHQAFHSGWLVAQYTHAQYLGLEIKETF